MLYLAFQTWLPHPIREPCAWPPCSSANGLLPWSRGRAFGSAGNTLTVLSLTLPQVAATLTAMLVAHDTLGPTGQRLLDDRMRMTKFNRDWSRFDRFADDRFIRIE